MAHRDCFRNGNFFLDDYESATIDRIEAVAGREVNVVLRT